MPKSTGTKLTVQVSLFEKQNSILCTEIGKKSHLERITSNPQRFPPRPSFFAKQIHYHVSTLPGKKCHIQAKMRETEKQSKKNGHYKQGPNITNTLKEQAAPRLTFIAQS